MSWRGIGAWMLAHTAAFFLAQVGGLVGLAWLPLGQVARAIRLSEWVAVGPGWVLGGWGMVWLSERMIFATLGVRPGAALLVVLLLSQLPVHVHRVRGALGSDNPALIPSELSGLIGTPAGIIAAWLYL